jgi:hypothetical protein
MAAGAMSLSLSNYEVAFEQRADILLVNDLTGVQYSTKTNSDGLYVVPNRTQPWLGGQL